MDQQEKKVTTATHALRELLQPTEDPSQVSKMLAGSLANSIGRISDDFWREMLEDSRQLCGVEGCDCGGVRRQVMEALDVLRDDWTEEMQKRGKVVDR